MGSRVARRGDYSARFKTNREVGPPTVGEGFMIVNSSPEIG